MRQGRRAVGACGGGSVEWTRELGGRLIVYCILHVGSTASAVVPFSTLSVNVVSSTYLWSNVVKYTLQLNYTSRKEVTTAIWGRALSPSAEGARIEDVRTETPKALRGRGMGRGFPLLSRLGSLGERRKLPQRGPGRSPGRKRF